MYQTSPLKNAPNLSHLIVILSVDIPVVIGCIQYPWIVGRYSLIHVCFPFHDFLDSLTFDVMTENTTFTYNCCLNSRSNDLGIYYDLKVVKIWKFRILTLL